MADLYKGLPANYGGFDPSAIVGGSGSAGYYQKSMGLPYYQGRGILATIPEYQRNPLMMEKDIMIRIREGRLAMMKSLYSYAEANGALTVNDVRFRFPVEIEPNQRFYLSAQSISAGATTNIIVDSNTTKIKTGNPEGNIKQVGDIARLEVGQFIMLMFSWVDPRRTLQPTPSSVPISSKPVPEICKIIAIDYDKGKITIERNWAGEQRTTTPTAPAALTIVANTASAVPGTSLKAKYAYFVAMAKSMKEDEIDSKISNYTGTWTHGILQRHLKAWGQQYLAEVIGRNLGLNSKGAETKRQAVEDYYRHWEMTSIFGEKSEVWDPSTGFWSGTTDGILSNIPKEHYVAIKGIDWSQIGNLPYTTSGSGLGSFHPLLFNKLLENYGYIGSEEKILLCGSGFHTAFSTMINSMTQNIPDIKSEWRVEGKRFTTSNGLKVDVVPSDLFSLNGLRQTAVLIDKKYFRLVKLNGYPTDMYDLQNENPLIKNGFIHGIQGFIDLNPDAHWVFTVIEKGAYADGNYYSAGATYGSSGLSNLGTYLS